MFFADYLSRIRFKFKNQLDRTFPFYKDMLFKMETNYNPLKKH